MNSPVQRRTDFSHREPFVGEHLQLVDEGCEVGGGRRRDQGAALRRQVRQRRVQLHHFRRRRQPCRGALLKLTGVADSNAATQAAAHGESLC